MKNKILILLVGAIILSLIFIAWFLASREYIDLRKELPKGDFQSVSLVQVEPGSKVEFIYLEIPKSEINGFQQGFISSIKNAEKTPVTIMKHIQLRIRTDKRNYFTYLVWTDNYVHFNGLKSYDLRKLFLDYGLETMKNKQKSQEPNQPEQ